MSFGITNVKGKNEILELLTTTTAPTESGGVITISTSDISGTPKVNSLLAYVDSDNISALYKITAISSGTATLSLVGNVGGGGGGSQRYLHGFTLSGTYTGDTPTIIVNIIIERTSATQFTKEDFMDWLYNNGFKGNLSLGTYLPCFGIASNGDIITGIGCNGTNSSGSFQVYKKNAITNQQLSSTSLSYNTLVKEIPFN